MIKVGEIVKGFIDKSNFSVSDIAKKIGTTNQNLYRILKKDSIETGILEQIAEILGIKIIDFFIDENDNENRRKIELEKKDSWEFITETYSKLFTFMHLIEMSNWEKLKPEMESVIGTIRIVEVPDIYSIWKYYKSFNGGDYYSTVSRYLEFKKGVSNIQLLSEIREFWEKNKKSKS
ncbi:MAG: helix-turn-helix domain-containing protein [Bacteroidales bacterium]